MINLLEQHIELREIFYLLDNQFVIKGYNSETAKWEKYIRQSMGKGDENSMTSLNFYMFANLEMLGNLSSWIFMETILYNHD